MARRYIDQVMKAAVLEELRSGAEGRSLSKKYGIAESTISRWRKEANIDAGPHHSAVIRSKPLKVDHVDKEAAREASAQRRDMIRHMVSLVNDLATGGGLKSHDIKNLSMAAKVLSEADQREQQLLEQEQGHASGVSRVPGKAGATGASTRKVTDLLFLGHGDKLDPRNMTAYFSVLDIEEGREQGNAEKVADATERLLKACESEGFSADEVDIDEMVRETSKEFGRFMRQRDRARARLHQKQGSLEAEYNGQGLA